MTRATREAALRKLRQARRLYYDAAQDHRSTAEELTAEAARLVDEVKDLEAGRPVVPRLERRAEAVRH